MSNVRVSRAARKSILSSLSTLGTSTSQSPARAENVPRGKILGTLAAAGAALAAVPSAEAGIVVSNPNANIGFANGDVGSFKVNIASLKSGSFKLLRTVYTTEVKFHTVWFKSGAPVQIAASNQGTYNSAIPAGAGKKFSTIGPAHGSRVDLGWAGSIGSHGAQFTDQYYAFSFLDASSQTHYGWLYGSVSGGYSDLTYNLISYAYDTTPGEMLPMGAVPEPSTLVMGAMAALFLGAAGARKWKKDQQLKAMVA